MVEGKQGESSSNSHGPTDPGAPSANHVAPDRSLLTAHLQSWLGFWPFDQAVDAPQGVVVVPSAKRLEPGWDAKSWPLIAVATRTFCVISVHPDSTAVVRSCVDALRTRGMCDSGELEHFFDRLAADPPFRAWANKTGVLDHGVFRWSETASGAPGTALPRRSTDSDAPRWLRPFGGTVYVELDRNGRICAGAGIKRHDRFGHELAVVTEPAERGRGRARNLITTAAHRVFQDGAVPTYLHERSNEASARVADATGFADVGWTFLRIASRPRPTQVIVTSALRASDAILRRARALHDRLSRQPSAGP